MNYTEILKVFAASENVQFKKICSEELEVLGFNKVNPYLSPSQYQEAVDESIALGPIPYKTAGGEVFRAIRAENHLKALRRSVYLNLIGSETSMDTSLMKAARYHFDNVIFKDTDLENRVVKSGGVDGVESIIKALLLERLKSIPVLNAFLTPKKMSAILAGDYAERKALLSRIQSNNEDIVAIVYRAYESLAKTTDWPNLFTAPSAADANNSVFATVSSLAQRQRGVVVVQSMGSDEIRKMSAYIFLLALRELEKGDDTVLQNWFFYVAEIRRAHNQNSKGIDNPSCYPGCVTRLAQALKSTALKVPVNFHQEVNEYIRQAMIKAFSSHLATLQTKEEKIKFYDAITALHFDYDETFRNDAVLKIIDKSMVLSDGEEWVDSEYLPIRAAFIREYFGNLEEALSTMLQSISHSGIVIPHESQYEVIAMIEKAFIEITHLGAICSMNAAMIKSLGLNNEPTFSLIQNPYFFYDDFESCLGKFNQNIVVAKHAYLENNLKFTLFNKVKGFFSSVEEAQFYVTELYFRVKSGFEMKGKSFDIKHIEEIRLAMEALVDNDEDLRLVSSKAYSYLPRGATRLSGVQVDHHASNPNNGHEPSKQNVKKKKKANNQKKRRRF